MTEKFSNQAVTTLSADITTITATSCTVTDASTFPASGNFRIKIDGEILLVTGVASLTFTITRGVEGTTAATHSSGANVIHLLTKGSLEARVANRFISDFYANKPAAGVKGRLFLPSDGIFIEYDDGAAWHKYGPYNRFKAPPQTGWTWVNQGNATATFTGSALIFEDPDMDGTDPQIRLYVRPLAAGTTSIVAAFAFNGATSMDGPCMGFCTRCVGGTDDGNFSTWGIRVGSSSYPYSFIHNIHYTSPTAVEQTSSRDGTPLWPFQIFWLKWSTVGTNKVFWYSNDGINWSDWAEVAWATYNSPTQFGIFIDPKNNVQKISMTLLHWEES